MTRYYLVAALLVVLAGSVVAALRRPPPDLRIAGSGSGTPTVEVPASPLPAASAQPFNGEGSWVLSALPGCLEERARVRGPAAAVAAEVPPPADRIVPPARLAAGPCTLLVRPHDIWALRGPDRLRVPPEAALYREAARGGRLTLVVRTGATTEIRRY